MMRLLGVAIVWSMLVGVTLAGEAPADADTLETARGPLVIHPVEHASFVMQWNGLTVAVDPVGDQRRLQGQPQPDVILVTHRHGDHFDADLVRHLAGEHTVIITSPDVAEAIPANDPIALHNGETTTAHGITVTAVPAYNRTESRLGFHPRGRDNGYVIDLAGFRVYVSGDTEDIPEMADLESVDAAFLCMNLPWTMSVAQAVRAVEMIGPKVVYPYHYRNKDGTFADLDALVVDAEVRLLDWY